MNYFILSVLLWFYLITPIKITFKEIRVLGKESSTLLYNIQDISLFNNTNIILTDKAAYRLIICDKELNHKFNYGDRGNTIGKFKGPSHIAVFDTIIAVSDFASSRIQILDKNFMAIRQFFVAGPVFDLAFNHRGELLIAAYTGKNETLFKYDKNFEKFETIMLKNLQGDMFSDIFKVIVLKNGNIVVAYLTQNKIEIFTSNGMYLSSFEIKDIQSTPNYIIEKNIKIPKGLIIGSLTSDSLSNIWILAGNYSIAPKREIFIYSQEGKLLRKTIFPNKIDDFIIDNNRLYTIESNRTIVKKYLITGI